MQNKGSVGGAGGREKEAAKYGRKRMNKG